MDTKLFSVIWRVLQQSFKLSFILLRQVVGRCVVLFITDYPRLKVDKIPEEDVFICENRYMARCRFFKKIKVCEYYSSPKFILIYVKEFQEVLFHFWLLQLSHIDAIFCNPLPIEWFSWLESEMYVYHCCNSIFKIVSKDSRISFSLKFLFSIWIYTLEC